MRNILDLSATMALGNWKPNISWHLVTVWISLVLNNFIKKPVNWKSSDLRLVLLFTCIRPIRRNVRRKTSMFCYCSFLAISSNLRDGSLASRQKYEYISGWVLDLARKIHSDITLPNFIRRGSKVRNLASIVPQRWHHFVYSGRWAPTPYTPEYFSLAFNIC